MITSKSTKNPQCDLIFKEYQVNSEIGSGFFLQNVAFVVSVTLLGLVRISKTKYRWKDPSLLKLLLTNLLVFKLNDCPKWVQEEKYAAFDMEQKRPKQSSKG